MCTMSEKLVSFSRPVDLTVFQKDGGNRKNYGRVVDCHSEAECEEWSKLGRVELLDGDSRC